MSREESVSCADERMADITRVWEPHSYTDALQALLEMQMQARDSLDAEVCLTTSAIIDTANSLLGKSRKNSIADMHQGSYNALENFLSTRYNGSNTAAVSENCDDASSMCGAELDSSTGSDSLTIHGHDNHCKLRQSSCSLWFESGQALATQSSSYLDEILVVKPTSVPSDVHDEGASCSEDWVEIMKEERHISGVDPMPLKTHTATPCSLLLHVESAVHAKVGRGSEKTAATRFSTSDCLAIRSSSTTAYPVHVTENLSRFLLEEGKATPNQRESVPYVATKPQQNQESEETTRTQQLSNVAAVPQHIKPQAAYHSRSPYTVVQRVHIPSQRELDTFLAGNLSGQFLDNPLRTIRIIPAGKKIDDYYIFGSILPVCQGQQVKTNCECEPNRGKAFSRQSQSKRRDRGKNVHCFEPHEDSEAAYLYELDHQSTRGDKRKSPRKQSTKGTLDNSTREYNRTRRRRVELLRDKPLTNKIARVLKSPSLDQKRATAEKERAVRKKGSGRRPTVRHAFVRHTCDKMGNGDRNKIVKVISKQKLPINAGGDRLWRRLCTRLLNLPAHRNLLKLDAILEDADYFYFVSERLEGGELFDFLLTAKTVEEHVCQYIVYQILEALHQLHSQALLHRDVKPENLMFRRRRSALLEKELDLRKFTVVEDDAVLTYSFSKSILLPTADGVSLRNSRRPSLQSPQSGLVTVSAGRRGRSSNNIIGKPNANSRCTSLTPRDFAEKSSYSTDKSCPSSMKIAPEVIDIEPEFSSGVGHAASSSAELWSFTCGSSNATTRADSSFSSSNSNSCDSLMDSNSSCESSPAEIDATVDGTKKKELPSLLVEVDRNFELVLIDFDTCKMLDVPSEEYGEIMNGKRQLVGTYGYLAPEVLGGHDYTVQSDLWSVGVILYMLMTGNPPLPMEKMTSARACLETFLRVHEKEGGINFDVTPLPDFPLARDLCKKLLCFAPSERISSALAALNHPWLQAFDQARKYSQERRHTDCASTSPRSNTSMNCNAPYFHVPVHPSHDTLRLAQLFQSRNNVSNVQRSYTRFNAKTRISLENEEGKAEWSNAAKDIVIEKYCSFFHKNTGNLCASQRNDSIQLSTTTPTKRRRNWLCGRCGRRCRCNSLGYDSSVSENSTVHSPAAFALASQRDADTGCIKSIRTGISGASQEKQVQSRTRA